VPGVELTLRRLTEIDPGDIIALMSDPLVRRHMPLARGDFGPAECAAFVEAKEALGREHGYGPWAFVIGGQFAGWGGLQPEGADADLGIVLHQRFWGHGRAIAEFFAAEAFDRLGFGSIIVLLPVSRAAAQGALRLGFVPDGATEFSGIPFQRFRLRKEDHQR
jgi:ribosomal-protein-alanine N-acetyltransferase